MSDKKIRRGYFQVEEAAIQKISGAFDKPSDTRNALFCYMVLCRKANLKRAWTFEDTVGSMAKDLFMAYRDAQKSLQLVEACGLLRIERRKVPGTNANAPSLYTVVRPSDNTSAPSDIMSVPCDNTSEASREDHVHDESRTFPNQYPKNDAKTFPNQHVFKKTSTSSDDDVHAFDESLKAECISEERREFIRKFNDHAKANPHALLPITAYTEELDKALDLHEDDGFEDLSATIEQEVRDFDGPPDKRLTLVRLVWGSY